MAMEFCARVENARRDIFNALMTKGSSGVMQEVYVLLASVAQEGASPCANFKDIVAAAQVDIIDTIITNGFKHPVIEIAINNWISTIQNSRSKVDPEADLKKAVRDVVNSVEEHNGNAPGHGHSVPGIWDLDNKEGIKGQPCERCAKWQRMKTLAGITS
jgi:hypothetical protein